MTMTKDKVFEPSNAFTNAQEEAFGEYLTAQDKADEALAKVPAISARETLAKIERAAIRLREEMGHNLNSAMYEAISGPLALVESARTDLRRSTGH